MGLLELVIKAPHQRSFTISQASHINTLKAHIFDMDPVIPRLRLYLRRYLACSNTRSQRGTANWGTTGRRGFSWSSLHSSDAEQCWSQRNNEDTHTDTDVDSCSHSEVCPAPWALGLKFVSICFSAGHRAKAWRAHPQLQATRWTEHKWPVFSSFHFSTFPEFLPTVCDLQTKINSATGVCVQVVCLSDFWTPLLPVQPGGSQVGGLPR